MLPALALYLSASAAAQTAISLEVRGAVPKPLKIDAAAWAKLPRAAVTATNGHDHTTATYQGVLLRDVLTAAGLPEGEKLRGKAVAMYIKLHATDNYDAVVAFAEVDPSFTDQTILVADAINGKSLDAKEGPLQLIVPNDKRPARWVRMLQVIEVTAAK